MNDLTVIARPNPLKPDTVRAVFPIGTSLAGIVGPFVDDSVSIVIEGEVIPREYWPYVKPKSGTAIEITRFPKGDTAKKIVGVVLMVVIAYFAPMFLNAMYSAFGVWGAVAAVGITMLATAVAYSLIPPPEMPSLDGGGGGAEFDRLNAITGTSNQAVPYGSIPMVIGGTRFYPTFAANPYTEILGDKQYLRLMFCLGYGNNMDVASIKIGETPITEYDGVEYEVSFDPDLFSDDVHEAQYADSLNVGDDEVIKVSQADSDELSVDIIFGEGLFGVNDRGETTSASTSFSIEYRPVGSSTWLNVASIPRPQMTISTQSMRAVSGSFKISSSARKALRAGVRWTVSNPGQFEIRIRRFSTTFEAGTNANARFDKAQLAVVRSVKRTNPSTTGTLKLAVRIEATDQLNGVINQLSVEVDQKIPVYNSSTGTWSAPQATYNPAWIYHWLLTSCPGIANHVEPSRMDLLKIRQWATECQNKGFTCRGIIDRPMQLGDLLKMVLSAGRATFSIRDGLYSVLFDRDGQVARQRFTPANSKNFSGHRTFVDLPHALRVQFQNPAMNWQEDEIIVLDDEHSWNGKDARGNPSNLPPATKFETMRCPFVTEPKAAWQLARYQFGQSIFRPNQISWDSDVEHLICTRGDVVEVVNDVINWGEGFGLITGLLRDANDKVTQLFLAEPMYMDTEKTYSVRVRTSVNNSYISTVQNPISAGEVTVLKLDTPMGKDVNESDLFMFGSSDNGIRSVIITRIEPMDDLRARFTAVPYHPDVLTFDDNPPTDFVSSITGNKFMEPPPPPNITAIFSHHTLPPNDGGTHNPGVTVTVNPGPSGYRGGGRNPPPWRNLHVRNRVL